MINETPISGTPETGGFEQDTRELKEERRWGGLPYKSRNLREVFSEGIIGDHKIAINNAGELAPDEESLPPSDESAADSDKLTVIYLFLKYGITT